MPKRNSPYKVAFVPGSCPKVSHEEADHARTGCSNRSYRASRGSNARIGGVLVEWLELVMWPRLGSGLASSLGLGVAPSLGLGMAPPMGLASRGLGVAPPVGLVSLVTVEGG